MERISAVTYLVNVENRNIFKHVNHIKKFNVEDGSLEESVNNESVLDLPNTIHRSPVERTCLRPDSMTPNLEPDIALGGDSRIAQDLPEAIVRENNTVGNEVIEGGAELPTLRRTTRVRRAPVRLDL